MACVLCLCLVQFCLYLFFPSIQQIDGANNVQMQAVFKVIITTHLCLAFFACVACNTRTLVLLQHAQQMILQMQMSSAEKHDNDTNQPPPEIAVLSPDSVLHNKTPDIRSVATNLHKDMTMTTTQMLVHLTTLILLTMLTLTAIWHKTMLW